jgi:hypothetical protein
MEDRKRIEERLRKKQHEVEALEEKLNSARIYVQALQEILNLLANDDGDGTPSVLRAGSAVAQARQIILDRGKPVHVTAILEAMGKTASRETRASLTSALAAYVRRHEMFTRPAPNTFGLVELGHTTIDGVSEPPAGFGRVASGQTTKPPTARPALAPAPPADLDDDIPF